MRISEIISVLNSAKHEFGDIDVQFMDDFLCSSIEIGDYVPEYLGSPKSDGYSDYCPSHINVVLTGSIWERVKFDEFNRDGFVSEKYGGFIKR